MCRALGRWWPLLPIGALLALAMPAQAEDTRREFAPEANAYFKVSDLARVYLQASVVGRLTQNTTDGELGAYFDYTFKPIFRPELLDAQWERNRYLWARVGYLLGGGQEGLKDFSERRVIVEATGRVLLGNELWLMHRGHVDFRDIDGQTSRRYRYRAAIERELTLSCPTPRPRSFTTPATTRSAGSSTSWAPRSNSPGAGASSPTMRARQTSCPRQARWTGWAWSSSTTTDPISPT
jgi:hypothetical protein